MYDTTFDYIRDLEDGWMFGKGDSIPEDVVDLAESVHDSLEGFDNESYEIFPWGTGGLQVDYYGKEDESVVVEYNSDGEISVFYYEDLEDVSSEKKVRDVSKQKTIEFISNEIQTPL